MADKTFFHILMHIGRLLERITTEELRALNLHHGQGRLLVTLQRCGSITQANLARGMDIKPATLTNMIKPLEKRNLIVKSPDPITNRAVVVKLTTEGENLAHAVKMKWATIEQTLQDTLIKNNGEDLLLQLEAFRNISGGCDPVFITHNLKEDNND